MVFIGQRRFFIIRQKSREDIGKATLCPRNDISILLNGCAKDFETGVRVHRGLGRKTA